MIPNIKLLITSLFLEGSHFFCHFNSKSLFIRIIILEMFIAMTFDVFISFQPLQWLNYEFPYPLFGALGGARVVSHLM